MVLKCLYSKWDGFSVSKRELVSLQLLTDAIGQKRRPALVLLDTGDPDIVVARITSQPYSTAFDVSLTHWQEAGLLVPSTARMHKIATLDQKLVDR